MLDVSFDLRGIEMTEYRLAEAFAYKQLGAGDVNGVIAASVEPSGTLTLSPAKLVTYCPSPSPRQNSTDIADVMA